MRSGSDSPGEARWEFECIWPQVSGRDRNESRLRLFAPLGNNPAALQSAENKGRFAPS